MTKIVSAPKPSDLVNAGAGAVSKVGWAFMPTLYFRQPEKPVSQFSGCLNIHKISKINSHQTPNDVTTHQSSVRAHGML